MDRDPALEAELRQALAAPPGNSIQLLLALPGLVGGRRREVHDDILGPVFLGLVHRQVDHLHGQFPVVPVHITEEGPGRRLGIPVELHERGVDAPGDSVTLDQLLQLWDVIRREVVELAAP
jgi:hypothetical protein